MYKWSYYCRCGGERRCVFLLLLFRVSLRGLGLFEKCKMLGIATEGAHTSRALVHFALRLDRAEFDGDPKNVFGDPLLVVVEQIPHKKGFQSNDTRTELPGTLTRSSFVGVSASFFVDLTFGCARFSRRTWRRPSSRPWRRGT